MVEPTTALRLLWVAVSRLSASRRMKMLNYKAGDTVRIRPREWMDAQERNGFGDIMNSNVRGYSMTMEMQEYAGKLATIILVSGDDNPYNKLDIDDGRYSWEDWMFDPDFRAGEPLSAEDAIRAMLDEETLYSKTGVSYSYSVKNHWFYVNDQMIDRINDTGIFSGLYRHSPKRKRPMTRFEVLAWVCGEASHGWVVRDSQNGDWLPPQMFGYWQDVVSYSSDTDRYYQRARLLPDLSGVDESTIQGFEVEE
jgi:hypothetical protein